MPCPDFAQIVCFNKQHLARNIINNYIYLKQCSFLTIITIKTINIVDKLCLNYFVEIIFQNDNFCIFYLFYLNFLHTTSKISNFILIKRSSNEKNAFQMHFRKNIF